MCSAAEPRDRDEMELKLNSERSPHHQRVIIWLLRIKGCVKGGGSAE